MWRPQTGGEHLDALARETFGSSEIRRKIGIGTVDEQRGNAVHHRPGREYERFGRTRRDGT